jgi:excisionase family DNA binding protein
MSDERLVPVTLPEMARRLRVPAKWLREQAIAGRIPHLRAGSAFLFEPSAVERAVLKLLRASSEEVESA